MVSIVPKSKEGELPDLKAKVRLRTRGYFVLALAVVLVLPLGSAALTVDLTKVSLPKFIASAALVMLTVFVAAIDSLIGSNAKNVLVFWRWHDPLPGCRAFTAENLDAESRIDRDRLKELVGGQFPKGTREQNGAWYKLHKSLVHDMVCQELHYHFLLFRDIAWLSVVFLVVFTAEALWLHSPASWAVVGFYVLLYAGFARAAANTGHKFVNQVLVTASTRGI